MQPEKINFVVCSVGPKYPSIYIQAAYNMAKKAYPGEFNFWVITDNAKIKEDLPDVPLNLFLVPKPFDGWWNKIWLFSDKMPKGRLVYFDLDLLILKDISEIVDSYTGVFCGDRDHIQWGHKEFPHIDCNLGTAFIMMESGSLTHVFNYYVENMEAVNKEFAIHGDQLYVSWMLNGQFDLVEDLPQKPLFGSYRWNVLGEPAENLQLNLVMPYYCWDFINFHGHPKPLELADKELWIRDCYGI